MAEVDVEGLVRGLMLLIKFNHWLTSCKSAELASR